MAYLENASMHRLMISPSVPALERRYGKFWAIEEQRKADEPCRLNTKHVVVKAQPLRLPGIRLLKSVLLILQCQTLTLLLTY